MRRFFIAIFALCACAEERPPGQDIDSCSVTKPAEQALVFEADETLIALYPIIELATAEVVCHPGRGDGCDEVIAERCVNDVGSVALGETARVEVTIHNLGPITLEILAMRIESSCPDIYIEGGVPFSTVREESAASFDLVVRPTALGACDAKLVVESSAGNAREGTSISITADRVDGDGPIGCTPDGTCCCGDAAPTCSFERLTCDQDRVWFGDSCAHPDRCGP